MTGLNRPGYFECALCLTHVENTREVCGTCLTPRYAPQGWHLEEWLRQFYAMGTREFALDVTRTDDGRLLASIISPRGQAIAVWVDEDRMTPANVEDGWNTSQWS